uniref:Uncharacterized protein n=1 Tax=Anguilla anguilla TaxID=7936 RepID=A0A0E9RVJ0_ANGAN
MQLVMVTREMLQDSFRWLLVCLIVYYITLTYPSSRVVRI